MKPEEIKNWDKLKSDADRDYVSVWSQITTVTINDSGFYMLDLISEPGFSEAKIDSIEKIKTKE